MPGAPLVLGPFPGGVNNRTDPGSILDAELNECVNFIYGVDGTLIGRWPFVTAPHTGLGGTAAALHILGSAIMYDSSMEPHAIVVGSSPDEGTWIYESGIWDKISNSKFDTFVPYGNQENLLFFPTNVDNPAQEGGIWQYGDASVTVKTGTPAGTTMCVHKERVWVAGNLDDPSMMSYTKITPTGAANDWDIAIDGSLGGFITVDPGFTQGITNIKAYADGISIFKNDSTYVLGFDGGISGQVVQVNSDIGADNNESVVAYQNILVVYHEGKVYAYGNGNFTALNDKYRFLSDEGYISTYTYPISLSAVGDFIVLRHYDKLFVYSFITGGWGEWETEFPVGNFVQLPMFAGDEVKTYFITSIFESDTSVYKMSQEWNATDTEDFVCSARTKVYNFDAPYAYKRLFWWGIEALTNMPVTGSAQPVSSTYTPTWEELFTTYIWDDLLIGTWGSLVLGIPDVVTGPVDAQQGVLYRRMYKFLKGLRFREISFRIELESNGTSTDGPPRLLSVVPILKAAETVVQQVS